MQSRRLLSSLQQALCRGRTPAERHAVGAVIGRCKNFHSLAGPKAAELGANDPIFCAASSSMRRLGAPIASPFRPNGVTIRSQGNESCGQGFSSTRPSLAVNYTAHVADSQRFLLQGPLFSRTSARADSQKRRSPVPFRIASRVRKRESCGGWTPMLALSYPNEASLCATALT